jgi:hypothetical protein
MRVELDDYYLANLIGVARFLNKQRVEWLDKYGHISIFEENKPPDMPNYYREYLHLHNVIKDAMKYRREHKKAVTKIWAIYAEDCIKKR